MNISKVFNVSMYLTLASFMVSSKVFSKDEIAPESYLPYSQQQILIDSAAYAKASAEAYNDVYYVDPNHAVDFGFFDGDKNWNKHSSSYSSLNGFKAVTFESDDEVVISYRGTDTQNGLPEFVKDGISDALLFIDNFHSQYNSALEYYNKVEQDFPNKKIVITGHSLGGSIAQFVGIVTKSETITFDSAPIQANFNDFGIGESIIQSSNILNIRADGDPVSFLGGYKNSFGDNVTVDLGECSGLECHSIDLIVDASINLKKIRNDDLERNRINSIYDYWSDVYNQEKGQVNSIEDFLDEQKIDIVGVDLPIIIPTDDPLPPVVDPLPPVVDPLPPVVDPLPPVVDPPNPTTPNAPPTHFGYIAGFQQNNGHIVGRLGGSIEQRNGDGAFTGIVLRSSDGDDCDECTQLGGIAATRRSPDHLDIVQTFGIFEISSGLPDEEFPTGLSDIRYATALNGERNFQNLQGTALYVGSLRA